MQSVKFLLLPCLLHLVIAHVATSAASDPLGKYSLPWTSQVKWDNVINIKSVKASSVGERLAGAQDILVGNGGGVVYFPAGVYRFDDHISIRDGVVLRGADPAGVTDARKEGYNPPTCFELPGYLPRFTEDEVPIDRAFKGIQLEDVSASNCGLLNIAVNRGHVYFDSEEGYGTGRNRFVVGCVFTNAAVADPAIPSEGFGQHPWQRFTDRHHAVVTVKALENILVANNRLPESGDDNFVIKDYVVEGAIIKDGVVFDYDNRPGLYVNDATIGGAGDSGPDGTPETHPWGFRKGIIIRDNYVFCTGRCAISFSGDGTICKDNVIRFEDSVRRPTTTGTNLTKGLDTNDNRAIRIRGWRWTVEGNDYLVYRNICSDGVYRINDGEGIMHEDHVNSTVLDSKLINNRGNRYLSIYRTAGIDGLLVRGNAIRTTGSIAAIYIVANRNSGQYECRNVTIEDNITAGGGIHIEGSPAVDNIIRNNKHIGPDGKIINKARANIRNNTGYTISR